MVIEKETDPRKQMIRELLGSRDVLSRVVRGILDSRFLKHRGLRQKR